MSQRSAEGVVLYVQLKSHTFLPKNTIFDLFIIHDLLTIYDLPFIVRMITHNASRVLQRIRHSLHSPSFRFSFTFSFDSIFVRRLVSYKVLTSTHISHQPRKSFPSLPPALL